MEITLTQELKDTCLYKHTSKDNGSIIYIGIGDEKRPYSKKDRSNFWRNTVKKHGGFDVTILKNGMSWEEACDLEIKMIAFYGRIKPSKENLNYGCLVNLTDGGDGAKGAVWSEESKERARKSSTGRKPNEESKQKMRKPKTEEHKQKMRKPKTEEHKQKMGKGKIGKKRPDVAIKFKGEGNPNFGKKSINSKKVICIITNKVYGCIREAAEDNGFNYGTLQNWLKGHRPNKTSLRYL
jgi:hypothetical protein